MEEASRSNSVLAETFCLSKVGQNIGKLIPFRLMPEEAAGILFGVIQQET